jgi:hypothetical protein
MSKKIKLAATALITMAGTFVGAMGGWDFGPLAVELTRNELMAIGAVIGFAFSGIGCHLAMEYAQAREQSRRQFVVLGRLSTLVPNANRQA